MINPIPMPALAAPVPTVAACDSGCIGGPRAGAAAPGDDFVARLTRLLSEAKATHATSADGATRAAALPVEGTQWTMVTPEWPAAVLASLVEALEGHLAAQPDDVAEPGPDATEGAAPPDGEVATSAPTPAVAGRAVGGGENLAAARSSAPSGSPAPLDIGQPADDAPLPAFDGDEAPGPLPASASSFPRADATADPAAQPWAAASAAGRVSTAPPPRPDTSPLGEVPQRVATPPVRTSAEPGPAGAGPVDALDFDTTSGLRPSASTARSFRAFPAVQQILDAVEQLELAPPPRQLTVELGALRVRVTLEEGQVRLTLLGGDADAGEGLLRDAEEALSQRGFDLGGHDRSSQDDPDPDRPEPVRASRPRREAAGLRL